MWVESDMLEQTVHLKGALPLDRELEFGVGSLIPMVANFAVLNK